MADDTKQDKTSSEWPDPGPEALRQAEALALGAVDILPEHSLAGRIQKSLDEGRPLRIKYGADPSAPDLHLGHTVPIGKLRQFQDFGHQVVFIIGDFTAMIGDPTGKSETRPRLTPEQVKENASTYFDQVYLLLDKDKTEVVYNSEWLSKVDLAETIGLAAKYTVARMLERDDFSNRFSSERPIYIHEFLYPLVQAYDSVAIRSDIEIGGTDQRFNFLLAREIQREMGQEPQGILTMPLLVGTDGVKKMSKSVGNYIGITEAPEEIFGKTMSVADEQMMDYLVLALRYAEADAKGLLDEVASGALHPRQLKARIAREVVTLFHGEEAAKGAEDHFNRLFREKDAPEDMEECSISLDGESSVWIAPVLVSSGLAQSNRKARQAIEQGSVRLDGEKVRDTDTHLEAGEYVLQLGKRNFRRVTVS